LFSLRIIESLSNLLLLLLHRIEFSKLGVKEFGQIIHFSIKAQQWFHFRIVAYTTSFSYLWFHVVIWAHLLQLFHKIVRHLVYISRCHSFRLIRLFATCLTLSRSCCLSRSLTHITCLLSRFGGNLSRYRIWRLIWRLIWNFTFFFFLHFFNLFNLGFRVCLIQLLTLRRNFLHFGRRFFHFIFCRVLPSCNCIGTSVWNFTFSKRRCWVRLF